MHLSIVIPAFNEETRIGNTLEKYLQFFNQDDVELIVVLNGCQDNTLGVVKQYTAQLAKKKLRIIEINEVIGKGGAVREGFKLASGDIIGFVDADCSTDPSEYKKLVDSLNGFDGAIASRWKRGSEVLNRKLYRKVISLGFIMLVRLLFWLPFVDTQCGAKVFKRKVITTIFPKLQTNNMAFDVELLYQIRRHGFKVLEMPSRWVDKSSSVIIGSPIQIPIKIIIMFFTLIKIRFRK